MDQSTKDSLAIFARRQEINAAKEDPKPETKPPKKEPAPPLEADYELHPKPNSNCRKCWGKGIVMWQKEPKSRLEAVPCQCVKYVKVAKKEKSM